MTQYTQTYPGGSLIALWAMAPPPWMQAQGFQRQWLDPEVVHLMSFLSEKNRNTDFRKIVLVYHHHHYQTS